MELLTIKLFKDVFSVKRIFINILAVSILILSFIIGKILSKTSGISVVYVEILVFFTAAIFFYYYLTGVFKDNMEQLELMVNLGVSEGILKRSLFIFIFTLTIAGTIIGWLIMEIICIKYFKISSRIFDEVFIFFSLTCTSLVLNTLSGYLAFVNRVKKYIT